MVSHFIIRGLLYPGAPIDDAEQLLFSQEFRWGYDVVNPPLYTWLVIAVQQIVGIEVWSVSLIKFPAYFLLFHFMYVLGLRVIKDHQLAILAALSPFLLYYIAWDSVLSYSHTVLAAAFILATLVSLVRVIDHRDVVSYSLFGLLLGIEIHIWPVYDFNDCIRRRFFCLQAGNSKQPIPDQSDDHGYHCRSSCSLAY